MHRFRKPVLYPLSYEGGIGGQRRVDYRSWHVKTGTI